MSSDPEKSPSKKDNLVLTSISVQPVLDEDDASTHRRLSFDKQPAHIVRGDESDLDEAAKFAKDRVVYSDEYNAKLVKKIDKRIVVFAGEYATSFSP
jgi:hypothetical protein